MDTARSGGSLVTSRSVGGGKKQEPPKTAMSMAAMESMVMSRWGPKRVVELKQLPLERRHLAIQKWEEEDKAREEEEAAEAAAAAAEAERKRRTREYADGSVYYGDYKADQDGATFTPHGHGRFTWPDGTLMYEGGWKDGRRDGAGKYRWRNGNVYEGIFRHDNLHGAGIFTPAGGAPRPCIYHNNQRICWVDELILGTRVELLTTKTQWKIGTIVKVLPGADRMVHLDGEEDYKLVDFGIAGFRLAKGKASCFHMMHSDPHG